MPDRRLRVLPNQQFMHYLSDLLHLEQWSLRIVERRSHHNSFIHSLIHNNSQGLDTAPDTKLTPPVHWLSTTEARQRHSTGNGSLCFLCVLPTTKETCTFTFFSHFMHSLLPPIRRLCANVTCTSFTFLLRRQQRRRRRRNLPRRNHQREPSLFAVQ